MWMRKAHTLNGIHDYKIGVFASGATVPDPNVFAPVLVLIIAILALMVTSSRAQSDDDSKPPAPTQSSKAAPPPPPDAPTSSEPAQSVMRTVTVSFYYDFSKFPPCSAVVTKKCIVQFNVYEVSAKMPGANAESDPYLCMTFAQVLPDSPASTAPSNSAPKQ